MRERGRGDEGEKERERSGTGRQWDREGEWKTRRGVTRREGSGIEEELRY